MRTPSGIASAGRWSLAAPPAFVLCSPSHSGAINIHPSLCDALITSAEYNSTHGSAHSCLSGALCRLKSGDRYVVRFIDGLASAQQVASSATPVRGAIAGRPLLLVQPNALVIGEFVPSSVSHFSEEIWRQAGEAEVQHCILLLALCGRLHCHAWEEALSGSSLFE